MRINSPSPAILLAVSLALAGCAPDDPVWGLVDPYPTVGPAGVAVDPTGARFVLDDRLGLFRLAPSGERTLELSLADLAAQGSPVNAPFTDLVAIGEGRFALTAIEQGFLLDLAARSLRLHFCYIVVVGPLYVRSDALAYDPVTDHLYAQPRMFDEYGVYESSLAGYSATTGDYDYGPPSTVLPVDFSAGGMAVVPDLGLVLGSGSILYRMVDNRPVAFDDLSRLGVTTITGLALDPTTGALVVLDGPSDTLVDVRLAPPRDLLSGGR